MATTEEKLRQKEIDGLKHKNKLTWINFITNISTYLCIVAFILVAWYLKWNWQNALAISATYLLEFFIIKYFDKNQS